MSCLADQLEKADKDLATLKQKLCVTETDLARASGSATMWEERARIAEVERQNYERGMESLQVETGNMLRQLEEQLDGETTVGFDFVLGFFPVTDDSFVTETPPADGIPASRSKGVRQQASPSRA